MSQTFVSKMLRINGAGGAIKSVFRSDHCNKVGNSAVTLSLVGTRSLLVARNYARYEKVRCFHTTPRNNLHPLLWVVVRPIAKLSAMVVGRGVRKWWSKLPQNKKTLLLQALNRSKFRLLGVSVFTGGAAVIYYETHLQDVPIIKRRRFIAFNPSQVKELADFHYKMLMEDYYGQTYSASHPQHKRVQNVANRIIDANRDIPEINEKPWLVTVVERPMQNAFVLPNGQIFVFQGMLDLCLNDDQLGIILGHEMAHVVLNHGAEMMSYLHLVDLLTMVLVGVIWAILPTDIVSALVQWMMHKFVYVLMELPYNRQLEVEADEIGLNLSAKACFDIRENAAFYQRLDLMQKADGDRSVEWLSTHPAHESRSTTLEEKLPQAMSLRLACKCPPLPAQDPRERKIILIRSQ